MSGPDNPHKGSLQAQVTVAASGPDNPHGNAMAATADLTSATGAAPTKANQTFAVLRQSVALRISIQKPEAFSVSVSAPDRDKVIIESIQVIISDDHGTVFTSDLVSQPCPLTPSGEPDVFPLQGEELEKALPHLRVGNEAEVRVVFSAPEGTPLTISIIGQKDHRSLGELVSGLFQKN